MQDDIIINGIETNNLKNINIKLKKHKINLIIGPSGSGKSSLAYDTIAQIGQHELMAMFANEVSEPTYKVKSFSNMMITIPVKQSNYNTNIRSTIGTYFGINRSVALIYALTLNLPENFFVLNKNENVCEICHGLGYIEEPDYNKIIDFSIPLKNIPFRCFNRYKDFFSQIIIKFCNDYKIDINKTFKELTNKERELLLYGQSEQKYSIRYKKTNSFSRRTTKFYGVLTQIPMLANYRIAHAFYSQFKCPHCDGKKYAKHIEDYKLHGLSIGDFMTMNFKNLKIYFDDIAKNICENRLEFTIKNLKNFIDKAVELNLGHLCFHRAIPTLSGGELQRLRIIQIFITQLCDLLIILDEPLAGLSQDEKKTVFDNIIKLSKKHTLVLVDHSDIFYNVCSNVITLGKGGGNEGEELIDTKNFIKLQNEIKEFYAPKISTQTKISLNSQIYQYQGVKISIANNAMNLITGRSGVGKSTLLREYLPQYFNDYLYINQKPLLANSNSNVATILNLANTISILYAKKYKKDKNFFSNLSGSDGVCNTCLGAGYVKYADKFHQEIILQCKECEATGFNKNLKKFKINNISIIDLYQMTLKEICSFFKTLDKNICEICTLACEIMLGHLRLGQQTSTLSGGENIRIKILKSYKSSAKIIAIDEPFKGLGKNEIDALARYLDKIRNKNRTIIVADHTESVEKYFSRHILIENLENILSGKILK